MLQFVEKVLLFLMLSQGCVAARQRNKFVYEKEISEHCQRRVIPSVFLGRQVMDAYSQVLYFSKVDLPYTCFISVRAESGSNIILVVQLLSAEDLISSCEEDPNQLLVYELGETFGGYWGPSMPQSFHHKEHNATSTRAEIYSIKYREETTDETYIEEVTDRSLLTELKESMDSRPYVEAPSFITIEVPLLNVSGHFEPGEEYRENSFEDESFDLFYDVMPRRQKVTYQSTVIPLVQFSVEKGPGDPRWGFQVNNDMADFDHNWNAQNHRQKDQQNHKRITKKWKLNAEIKHPFLQDQTNIISNIADDHIEMMESDKSKEESDDDAGPEIHMKEEPWVSLDELLYEFNKTGSLTTVSDDEINREVSVLLEKLSGLENNESAYLFDIDDIMTEKPPITHRLNFLLHSPESDNSDETEHSSSEETIESQETDEKNGNHISSATVPLLSILSTIDESVEEINKFDDNITSYIVSNETESIDPDKSYNYTITENNTKESDLNITENRMMQNYTMPKNITTVVEPTLTAHTRSLLDHESWENLVRAAPDMAVRLDERAPQKIIEALKNNSVKTNASERKTTTEAVFVKSTTSKKKISRGKRFIQGIMIEDSKPHNLTTKDDEMSTTTSSAIHVSDVQKFAQLVELVDDDIHERAALRYLSQYVGRPMFNLCDYEQPKPRYVHLFNSSRLVIALSNFTLRRMQLVITPARKLYTGKSRCEQSHLECQVAGNRVCIDAMSACDGVANCGEPDIYDEDRLMCGAYVGLRHNVCLAAITFLAVLLTLIYMVHYWLGRCVPKVSEAFFIYTEGDENILYLDTIMRSPNDTGFVVGKSFDIFEGDPLFMSATQNVSKIRSWTRKLLPCFFKKVAPPKTITEEWDQMNLSSSNIMFPFPDLEIGEITAHGPKDASVQTGESLEMKYLKCLKKTNKEKEDDSPITSEQQDRESLRTLSYEEEKLRDELILMKYLKRARNDTLISRPSHLRLDGRNESITGPSANYEDTRFSDEIEIKHLSYDEINQRDQGRPRDKKPGTEFSTNVDVHTEVPKSIKSKHLRFNEDVVNIPRNEEDSDEEISALQYDEPEIEPTEETEHAAPSTSIDFKRFWGGGSKGKKTKKKTLPR